MRVAFYFLTILSMHLSYAQTNTVTSFKEGDRFMVETADNCNSVYQSKNRSFQISYKLRITQLFTIAGVTGDDYIITVVTNKIVDTVNALGKEVFYNSDFTADSLSIVEKAIKKIINRQDTILVNKQGKIRSASNDTVQDFTDDVIPFTGIYPTRFVIGSMLAPFSDFQAPVMKNGYRWRDSSNAQNAKIFTKYSIRSNIDSTTAVTYIRTIMSEFENINSNGIVLINNLNGFVMQRKTQNVKLENKLINNILFSIESRSAVNQDCTFLPVR